MNEQERIELSREVARVAPEEMGAEFLLAHERGETPRVFGFLFAAGVAWETRRRDT